MGADIGIVTALQANYYRVRLPGLSEVPLLCTRRALLKKIGQNIMVGDRVRVEEIDLTSLQGVITEVLPRCSEFPRPPVANAEQILLVFSLAEPPLEVWQLSRFLVKAESTQLKIALCLNKRDLVSETTVHQWRSRLENWGYDPIFISVLQQQGLKHLQAVLSNQITLMAGPSGVGKSSLINCLIPEGNQLTNSVSGKLQKGRHTTRHVELFELPTGGLLADTPGFNQPDLEANVGELINWFPEGKARRLNQDCHFNDCLHRDEPHCLIRGDWERYEHYLKFLEEAIARQTQQQKRRGAENSLKLKTKAAGESHYEPKLASKTYRRPSRRFQQQNLPQSEEDL